MRRHRRRSYALADTRSEWQKHIPLAMGIVALCVVLYFGYVLIRSMSSSFLEREQAIAFQHEQSGAIFVSLDGADWQPGENAKQLYPNDGVRTSSKSQALLTFFDGTSVRLDENTSVRIVSSQQGSEGAGQLSLSLQEGRVWLKAPASQSKVRRTLSTPLYSAVTPEGTEVLSGVSSLSVLESSHSPVAISLISRSASLEISEGQRLSLPGESSALTDLVPFRSALPADVYTDAFVMESQKGSVGLPGAGSGSVLAGNELLQVNEPAEGAMIAGSTAVVSGTVSSVITTVRVNGYAATITGNGTFSLTLALPSGEQNTQVVVEGLDRDGEVRGRVNRTIVRSLSPMATAHFTSPAKDGERFTTTQTRLELVGTAPDGAAGIQVNDYKLQLFKRGDKTWKYLAAVEFKNLQYGENKFEAFALSEDGSKSDAVTLTVVVEQPGATSTSTSATGAVAVPILNNDPLEPGTLTITGPSSGEPFMASGTGELLIEGKSPRNASTLWVNDYQLRLFEPKKGFWNYIASTKLGTLKRGANTYVVVARNDKGEVVDRVSYVINYQP